MLSRGGAVLVDFALLEVKISRPWFSPGFSPHLWQFPSLPLKDCVVVGKDIATCVDHAAPNLLSCGVEGTRACAGF